MVTTPTPKLTPAMRKALEAIKSLGGVYCVLNTGPGTAKYTGNVALDSSAVIALAECRALVFEWIPFNFWLFALTPAGRAALEGE